MVIHVAIVNMQTSHLTDNTLPTQSILQDKAPSLKRVLSPPHWMFGLGLLNKGAHRYLLQACATSFARKSSFPYCLLMIAVRIALVTSLASHKSFMDPQDISEGRKTEKSEKITSWKGSCKQWYYYYAHIIMINKDNKQPSLQCSIT